MWNDSKIPETQEGGEHSLENYLRRYLTKRPEYSVVVYGMLRDMGMEGKRLIEKLNLKKT